MFEDAPQHKDIVTIDHKPLFRQQVFESQKHAWLGEVVLSKHLSFAVFALFFGVFSVALLAYLVWGEYTRKIKATGYIVPSTGILKISTPTQAVLSRLLVREGQSVKAGDTLALLDTERATNDGNTMDQLKAQLQLRSSSLRLEQSKLVEIHQQQKKALLQRHQSLSAERNMVDQTVSLQTSRANIADQMLVKYKAMFSESFMPELAVKQKEQEQISEHLALQAALRSRSGLQRDLESVATELAALPAKQSNEGAALDRALAEVEQNIIEVEARRQVLIRAPADGTVTAVLSDAGKFVTAGQPLLSPLPDNATLQADVYLPTGAAGFVHIGTEAMLQFQAFPYQKFGSQRVKVNKLARVAVLGSELPYPPANSAGDLYYIAKLELAKTTVLAYGKEELLQPGMKVDANLILERRTLLEWLFEPVLSVYGNLAP